MSSALQAAFLDFIETCETWHGQPLHVQEAISTNGQNFNRHFTTHSELQFRLTRSYVRLSGGRLVLQGNTHCYEIWADRLRALTWPDPAQVELLEQYGDTVFRRTVVRILSAAL